MPSEGFAVTRGEPVAAGLHGPRRQHYCPHCKNWMFTHAHGMDFFVNVRATMLGQHDWVVPFVEVYTSEKLHGRRRQPCTASRRSRILQDTRR